MSDSGSCDTGADACCCDILLFAAAEAFSLIFEAGDDLRLLGCLGGVCFDLLAVIAMVSLFFDSLTCIILGTAIKSTVGFILYSDVSFCI